MHTVLLQYVSVRHFVNPDSAWSPLMSERSTDVITVKENIQAPVSESTTDGRKKKCNKDFELS